MKQTDTLNSLSRGEADKPLRMTTNNLAETLQCNVEKKSPNKIV